MKILYFSGYNYSNSTFIETDFRKISSNFETKYISYIENENNKIECEKSELVSYTESSLKSKLIWSLEKIRQ